MDKEKPDRRKKSKFFRHVNVEQNFKELPLKE